jgi:hypothetical protein
MNNRPFRDLLNQLSWFPTLSDKQKYEQDQQLNEVIVIV